MTFAGIVYPAGYDQPVASAARYLLQTIVTLYAQKGVTLPERQMVTIGSVAVDEPVLAVMYGGVSVGPPGHESSVPDRGDSPRTLLFNVELWRETPNTGPSGSAPNAALVSAAAEITMQDSWLLVEAAFASDQTGIGVIARATVNEPHGAMIGVSMMLEMAAA
jgi:hypothetical protein